MPALPLPRTWSWSGAIFSIYSLSVAWLVPRIIFRSRRSHPSRAWGFAGILNPQAVVSLGCYTALGAPAFYGQLLCYVGMPITEFLFFPGISGLGALI